MMITGITLDKFKCFASSTFFPMSQITLLYGKNGRGKSSVIQSLLLISQSLKENGGTLGPLVINGNLAPLVSYNDILSKSTKQDENIQIDLHLDGNQVYHASFSRVEDKPTIAEPLEIRLGSTDYIINDSYMSDGTENERDATPKKIVLPQSDILVYSYLSNLSYVSAERMGPRNNESRKDNLSINDVNSRGDYLINVLSNQTEEFQTRFEQELSLILSGATVRINANPDSPDRIEMYLDSTDDNEMGFKPSNVGFGYSYVLPIVFKTMTASKGNLVIIENPEAHLYPGAQSRLVDFLVKYSKKNNLQLILETHSDHIINGLRLAVKEHRLQPEETSILFFNRDAEVSGTPSVESIKINERGALSNQPEDFMDEWTRQLMELI